MRPTGHIYQASPKGVDKPFRQGEILSGVLRMRLDLQTLGTASEGILVVTHVYAVMLTQDCDLEQDFRTREAGGAPNANALSRRIPNILPGNVTTAEELKAANNLQGDLWRRVPQNKDERYHRPSGGRTGLRCAGSGIARDGHRFQTILHPSNRRALPARGTPGDPAAVRAEVALPGAPQRPVLLLSQSGGPARGSLQRAGGEIISPSTSG